MPETITLDIKEQNLHAVILGKMAGAFEARFGEITACRFDPESTD